MKQLLASLLLVSATFFLTSLKTDAQAPANYKAGYVITADGGRQEGYIKESFRSKAAITFQSTDGKKTTYYGTDVKELGIDGVSYIAYSSDFFKVISTGAKVSLYQKVSDASGKVIYNGSEVAGISNGTEGSLNDHFLKTTGGENLVLITKKNFSDIIAKHCTDCPTLLESVKNNTVNYVEIEKAVKLYNECR